MAHSSLNNARKSTDSHYLNSCTSRSATGGIVSRRFLLIFFPLIILMGTANAQPPLHPSIPCGSGSEKLESCQRSGADCTCFSETIKEQMQEDLYESKRLQNREPNVLLKLINTFHCPCYIRLPHFLSIEMGSDNTYDSTGHLNNKRRILQQSGMDHQMGQGNIMTRWKRSRRIRREIKHGYPDEKKFKEIITKIESSSHHHYATVGSQIKLPCFNEEEDQGPLPEEPGKRKFNWTHANGHPITTSLLILNKANGDLTFKAVRLADIGLYNCTVTDDDGDVWTYQSQLDVITTPLFWLKFEVTYQIDRCRRRELIQIQWHLLDWVHQYVCSFCPVRNISVTCGGEKVHIKLALSALGFEDLIHGFQNFKAICPVQCVESMHAKILNIMAASLRALFSLPINVEPVDGKTTVYEPVPNSAQDDITLGCPSGFFENYKLCFPCAAGKYSAHGTDKCSPCQKNYFQPNPGSSACFPCPKGFETIEEGSRSQAECMLEVVTSMWSFIEDNWLYVCIGATGCLLILLLCLVCCCCPDSGIGRCLRCKCFRKGGDENADEDLNQTEKLIQDESTEETEEEDERQYNASSGKRTLWSRMNRPWKMPKFPKLRPHRGYQPFDDDRSTEGDKIDTSSISDGDELKPLPPEIQKLNLPSPASLSRKRSSRNNVQSKARLFESSEDDRDLRPLPPDIENMNLPSPANCKACKSNLDLTKRSRSKVILDKVKKNTSKVMERLPSRHFRSPTNTTEDSGPEPPPQMVKRKDGRHCFKVKKPHMKLGGILNKSKSLQEKLAQQRKKIGDFSSRSISTIGAKLKGSKSNVRIAEHNNTYHHGEQRKIRKKSQSPKTIKQIFKSKSKWV